MDEAVGMASGMITSAFVAGAITTFVTGFEGKAPTANLVTEAIKDAIDLIAKFIDDTVEALMLSISGLLLVLISATIKGPVKIFQILVGFAMSFWGLLRAAINAIKEKDLGKKIFNTACAIVGGIGAVKGLLEYHEGVKEYGT